MSSKAMNGSEENVLDTCRQRTTRLTATDRASLPGTELRQSSTCHQHTENIKAKTHTASNIAFSSKCPIYNGDEQHPRNVGKKKINRQPYASEGNREFMHIENKREEARAIS